jgi:2Fe-2S ferredoxin
VTHAHRAHRRSDVDIEVNPGESVAEAAWRQGYEWPTKCWGQLECMQCFVRVKAGDGEVNIVPAGEEEVIAMRTMFPPRLRSPMVRLGCRITVCGEGVVLEKKGVKPPTAEAAAS